MRVAALAALLVAAPLEGQVARSCSETELQEAADAFRSILGSGWVGVGGTPDDYVLTVAEHVWMELDPIQRRSLLIAADVYAQCVLWPRTMRPDNPDTWVCGIKVHTSIASIQWQSPKPVAELKATRDGVCEFRRLP